jgi:ligand-binding sensor domain-containing protein/two-component sensor histidine kinase
LTAIKGLFALFLNGILLLFIITVQPSLAQTYNFRNYSLDDGLSQSEITCMFEDSRGYLWIGTAGGGLNRFDGKEFKIYEEKDGLCGQIISAVSEDADHNILIGNVSGKLCEFNGQLFTRIDKDDKVYKANGKVDFITSDDNNNMLIARNGQFFLNNGRNFENLLLKEDTLSGYKANCFKKDSRNIVWIGTSKGLFVLKNKTLLRIKDAGEISNGNITSITEDINGTLWAVENNTNFYKIQILGPSHYQVKADKIELFSIPSGTVVNDIHFDQRNQLWIATANKGIFKFRDGVLENFNQNNGLSVDAIKNIYEDKSGTLWFGTFGGGLLKLANQAYTYYDNIPGLKEKDIFAILSDKKGDIWIGTYLHGVYKFDGKKCTSYSTSDLAGNSDIRCLFADRKGNIWLGGNNGIVIYNGKSFHPYDKNKNCKVIRAIFEDKDGNMWIGTQGNGIFIDNGKEIKRLNDENGINNNAYVFVQDRSGKIWIGTSNGIYVYNGGKIVTHLTEGGFGYVGSMMIDKFGATWAATDIGLSRYKDDQYKAITVKDGLASAAIYIMSSDIYDNIWVGTNKGLDKITLNGKGEIATIRNYSKNEGFKGIECNSRAVCVDKNGCLWFGTIKGAIKFDPKEEFFHAPETPQVHITDIKLFYETADWKKYSDSVSHWYNLPYNAVLPYNKNHLTFNFSAFSKAFPENIRYTFKLEGFDKEWSPIAEINSITYSNLAPGKYVFLVKAINKSGVSSKTSEEFIFTIKEPFWTTWWFISLGVISLIIFIYFYNKFRRRRYFLFQKRLEKIIKQRTKEIAQQRDTNEILLKEVHHRVKNNLQIINSLINIQSNYVEDPKSIEIFREIRNRIRTITLVHEKLYKSKDFGNINVKEYINMLVEGLVDTYSINKQIDLKLNLEVQYFNLNTIIPIGLLLNEIISNSFKYGFNNLEHGIIEVDLYKSGNGNEYTLMIGDNGVGYDYKLFENQNATLGLELIKILSTQLNGVIEKIDKPGTYYLLKFTQLKD